MSEAIQLSGKPEDLAPILTNKLVLETEQFGGRQIVSLLSELTAEDWQRVQDLGIEQAPLGLQKLFVLLTKN